MAQHNLTHAAKLAGISRSTMMRHISEGKVSKGIGKDGKPYIETSELERVYGLTQSQEDTQGVSLNSRRTPTKTPQDSHLKGELEALRQEKIVVLEKQIEALQAERDNWQQEAQDWKLQAQSLLTDQRPQAETLPETPQKPSEAPSYHLGWFDRLLGRKPLRSA